jgi:hypothetical protein
MALLQDLIQQIDDPVLRERIMQETDKLVKQKKFGLVFEEHLPECTPLYDVPIRVGCKVALKTGYVSDIYTVLKIDGDTVLCDRRETHEQKTFQMSDIVAVAEFGEPIYPTLKPLDFVENAPDSDLWHTLIEADNYHALQLLEYLYAEKVDCIYIDPPYNTGAKDWKYNNDYVDSSDAYRHSKWLSMMEKRLKIAKKLLDPKNILPGRKFTYPKSLYAVHDTIRFITKEKKEALIVDFFAGSGTTLHAINLLNSEDGGHRRCIMVTNNEVSVDEAKVLDKQGHKPGDAAWEKVGIARYVTWPRTVCSIEGHDVHGKPLKGNYLSSDLPMSDGFKANAAFFKLSFLDKTSIALGMQFKELLPVLWMKGGAIDKCPVLEGEELPNMLILPKNKMAVLIDEIFYPEFEEQLAQHPEIQTVFIVTDSEAAYREMIRAYESKACYQLYRDYLDNFRINTGR